MALLRSGPARIDTQLDGLLVIGVAVADQIVLPPAVARAMLSSTILGLVFSEAGVVADHAVEEIEPPELIQLLSCRSLSVIGGEPDPDSGAPKGSEVSCAPSREIRSANVMGEVVLEFDQQRYGIPVEWAEPSADWPFDSAMMAPSGRSCWPRRSTPISAAARAAGPPQE